MGADSLASSSAIRAACASINAACSSSRASFSVSLSRYLGPLVTHMLTHIREPHATSFRQPGEQLRMVSIMVFSHHAEGAVES